MTPHRAKFWVWWLLPLLVARSLMPVGFMAQVSEGQFKLVFCSAGYAQNQGVDRASAHGTEHQNDSTQSDFSCPFAHATAAPLLDISSSEVIVFIPSAEILLQPESPYYAAGPPRVDRARGPPVHS